MGALKDLYRIGIPIARANHVLDLFAHLIPLSEKVNNIIKNHVHHYSTVHANHAKWQYSRSTVIGV